MSKVDEFLTRHRDRPSSTVDQSLQASPAKKTVLVTCMDTRINPYELFKLSKGEVHILRNAGGLVRNDTLRSIAISQAALGTEAVMIVQHTDCGMSKLTDEGIADLIENSSGTRPHHDLGAFTELQHSIQDSVGKIKNCDFIAHRTDVRGFILDVETGELEEV